ncbi:MAG TPA: hypothetical protein PKY99_06700 [Turneriella sp.]|nr:hypothetical protein [Turneriella sp.]
MREYEFWFAEVRILRRRKQYPPLIVAGAFAFGVAEIALLAPRLPTDGYSALTLLYLFAIAWLAVLVAAQPNRHYLLSLPLLFAAMPLLLLAPAWFFFTVVHTHNLFPLVTLWKRKDHPWGERVVWLLLYFALPALLLLVGAQSWLSAEPLPEAVEAALFRRTVPHAWPFAGTLLMALFAYWQILHYALWLLVLPRAQAPSKFSRFPQEILFFLGVTLDHRIVEFFLVGAIAVTAVFFLLFPVPTLHIYLAVSASHTFIELPFWFRRGNVLGNA